MNECKVIFWIVCCLVGMVSCNTGSSNKKAGNAEKDSTAVAGELSVMLHPEKPSGITFNVDEVTVADSLLPVYNAKNIIEGRINAKASFFPPEHQHYELVHTADNAFVQTIHYCYAEHRPLILSPDNIWLLICQGVSIHVNQNFKALEQKIFLKDRPKEIIVRNDSLEYGAKYWEQLVTSFAGETKQYTKDDFYSFFVADFTTTTKIEQTAYQIALLETYKRAFTYVGETGCGIPSITLAGTREDWIRILTRLDKLEDIGLGYWADELRPVIQQFVNVYDKNINTAFWQSIYKDASEYAAFYISGWMIKFFPYIKVKGEMEENAVYDERNEGYPVKEGYKLNPYLKKNDYLLSRLSTDNFPSELSKVEIIWNNHFKDETKRMDTYSGFFAIIQYPDKSLQPFISWAITDRSAVEAVEMESKFPERKPPYNYWSPNLADSLLSVPVYDAKYFGNQRESLDYIRNYIEDRIRQDSVFVVDNLKADTLRFTILTNGAITNIRLDNDSSKLRSFVEEQLLQLPASWTPALAYVKDVLDGMMMEEDELKQKVKVNSEVKMELFNK